MFFMANNSDRSQFAIYFRALTDKPMFAFTTIVNMVKIIV